VTFIFLKLIIDYYNVFKYYSSFCSTHHKKKVPCVQKSRVEIRKNSQIYYVRGNFEKITFKWLKKKKYMCMT